MAKSVAVARLKAALSEYLAQVKAGQEVIVTERGRPIAKVVPLSHDAAAELAELARAGLIRLGSGRLPAGFWKLPRPGATRGAGVKALVDERRETR
jgi:prevent-host-death family protein